MNSATANSSTATRFNWLTILATLGAIWYFFGLVQFWLAYTMDPSAAAAAGTITQDHADALATTPMFVWVFFASASGMGLLGAIQLLRRAKSAALIFALSLASAVSYYTWIFATIPHRSKHHFPQISPRGAQKNCTKSQHSNR